MSLWDWLTGQIKGKSKHLTQIIVPDANTPSGSSGAALVAEEQYLRLWLAEMFLKDDHVWFTSRFPTVHSVVGLQFGNQNLELANIAGTSKLDIHQVGQGHAVTRQYALTSLLPFHGGVVQLDCGLMSMKSDNTLEKFAGVVGDFANKLTVPQVSSVITLAASVAGGVQELLGAGDADPRLYYHTSLTGQGGASPLVSGFIFVSDQADGTLDPKQLWVTPQGVRYGAAADVAKPLDGQEYFLIQIEAVTERDDWRQLTVIAEPFQTAVEAKLSGDEDKAKQYLAAARIAAMKSADLTGLDRKRVVAALVKELEAAAGGVEGAALESTGGPRSAIESAVARISIDEARRLPDPTEAEILSY